MLSSKTLSTSKAGGAKAPVDKLSLCLTVKHCFFFFLFLNSSQSFPSCHLCLLLLFLLLCTFLFPMGSWTWTQDFRKQPQEGQILGNNQLSNCWLHSSPDVLMSLGWGPVTFVIVSDIIHVYFSYKTWIGNRRRKYRLMGIEVPPPRGGPADFSDQSEFVSKSALNPGEETATEVGDDNDRNDEVSICLSEGSSQGIWNAVTTVPIFSILCSVHALDSVVHIQKRLTESQVLHPAWAEGTGPFLLPLCLWVLLSLLHKNWRNLWS